MRTFGVFLNHNQSMITAFAIRLTLVFLLLLQSGCDQILNFGKNTIDDVIATTEDSLTKITQESIGWRTELQNSSQ